MLDEVLIDQNKHWSGLGDAELMERVLFPNLLKYLPIPEIMVLTGVRRCGKTTHFKFLINHLLKETSPNTILYLNFDDPSFQTYLTDSAKIYELIDVAEKLVGDKIKYLFLDEIQNVEKWEQFVKSTHDSKVFKKIFITGSNSSLLNSDYGSLLTGRYIESRVYPMSFHEILLARGIPDRITMLTEKGKMLGMLEDMMHFGGFPRVVSEKDNTIRRDLLINYYNGIIYKDCVLPSAIRDTKTFLQLAHYLISNIGSLFSYNNLSASLNASDVTLKEFTHILTNSFTWFELTNFSWSLQTQTKAKKKSYIIDNGLFTAVAFQVMSNAGKLLENLVFTELTKKFGGDSVYFHNDKVECDFIVKDKLDIIAIQVCYELTPQNRSRELQGLATGMEKFSANRGYIITFNQEETLTEKMQISPFWKLFGFDVELLL
jgi:predicted AAA+ superfamily ATPase